MNEILPCYTLGRLSSWDAGCNSGGAAIEAVQIEGHTDADGQDNSNVTLSTNRANEMPRLVMRGRTPHVAFYTEAGLEYAVWDSGAWTRDTVDIAESYHNGNPALVFDRDGHPHVAWFRGTPWYARWDGAEWQREEIAPDSAS